jgi:hypothetical protein
VLNIQTAGTTAIAISAGQVATFAQAPVLPAASIPQAALAAGVAGNGPAFSAYQNAQTSISPTNTFVKIPLQAELFDTANAFDSTTNYRFTPLVAGYYQINAFVQHANSAATFLGTAIYKNGVTYREVFSASSPGGGGGALISTVVNFNGSTDYVELYGIQNSGGAANTSGLLQTYMSGALIRSA